MCLRLAQNNAISPLCSSWPSGMSGWDNVSPLPSESEAEPNGGIPHVSAVGEVVGSHVAASGWDAVDVVNIPAEDASPVVRGWGCGRAGER